MQSTQYGAPDAIGYATVPTPFLLRSHWFLLLLTSAGMVCIEIQPQYPLPQNQICHTSAYIDRNPQTSCDVSILCQWDMCQWHLVPFLMVRSTVCHLCWMSQDGTVDRWAAGAALCPCDGSLPSGTLGRLSGPRWAALLVLAPVCKPPVGLWQALKHPHEKRKSIYISGCYI